MTQETSRWAEIRARFDVSSDDIDRVIQTFLELSQNEDLARMLQEDPERFYRAFQTLSPYEQLIVKLRFGDRNTRTFVMSDLGIRDDRTYAYFQQVALNKLGIALGMPLHLKRLHALEESSLPKTIQLHPPVKARYAPQRRGPYEPPAARLEIRRRTGSLSEAIVQAVAYVSRRELPFQLDYTIQHEAERAFREALAECLSYIFGEDMSETDYRVQQLAMKLPLPHEQDPYHTFEMSGGPRAIKEEALQRLALALETSCQHLFHEPIDAGADYTRAARSVCAGMADAYNTLTRESVRPFDRSIFETLAQLAHYVRAIRPKSHS